MILQYTVNCNLLVIYFTLLQIIKPTKDTSESGEEKEREALASDAAITKALLSVYIGYMATGPSINEVRNRLKSALFPFSLRPMHKGREVAWIGYL